MSVLESSRKMTIREQTAYDLGFHEGRNVAIVHGRWEHAEYHGFLRCSKCKDVYIDDTWVADGKWNYCPNCGALMDGRSNVPRTDGDGNA